MAQTAGLKRSVGLWLLVFYGLGNILGAGIYVLVGKVAGAAGYFTPLSFVMAAIIAGITAFSYAELSSRYPVAAGEAVYLQEGFGLSWLSVLTGLMIAMTGMLSSATILRGLVGYMQVFFAMPDAVLILSVLSVLGLVSIWGIAESVKVAAVFTAVEMFGLLLIIAVGSWVPANPEAVEKMLSVPTSGVAWSGIMLGAFLAFYAFIGYEDMVNVAEEVIDPTRNMPRAIILALVISTLLYALVSSVAVLNLTPQNLAESKAPLADVYTAATGDAAWMISAISGFAVINGALIQIIMASRIFYGMSRRKWLPQIFSKVWEKTQTPVFATGTVVFIIAVLALLFPLLTLAESTSYLVLLIFLLVNLALLKIKRRVPASDDVTCYPEWVPVMGAIGAVVLLLAQVSLG